MNDDDLADFFDRCPRLYHMAWEGSWPLIERIGLRNTSDLLSQFEVPEEIQTQLMSKRRPASVPIEHPELGSAVVRDQIPLSDADLEACLLDGLTPADWHKRLNERVFFWTNRDRLVGLLSARAYRKQAHDVIEVETEPLVKAYRHKIELSPMNSGCTRPWRHPRGKTTFLPIKDYPYRDRLRRSKKDDAVVELTVLDGVPNIKDFTVAVNRMQGDEVLEKLFP